MAGRGGRGGGGRGRGRGGMSFNLEELGFNAGEALPGPVLQPPPLYPPMERTPVPLKSDSEVEYLLALKRDFVEFLKYSPSYLLPTANVKDIERYSDMKNIDSNHKSNTLAYEWKRYPAELRPSSSTLKKKRTKLTNGKNSKKVRFSDVENKLAELEKQEEQSDTEEKGEENKENEKEGEEQQEEIEDEDQDEEMDDGTDYVNDYFDNGESYLDEEDDNLDDGPVY